MREIRRVEPVVDNERLDKFSMCSCWDCEHGKPWELTEDDNNSGTK